MTFERLVAAFRAAGLPKREALREACAEVLAPYETAQEARAAARMLKASGGRQITPRGYLVSARDIEAALRAAKSFRHGVAVTAPLLPAAAGAVHAAAAREFHQVLRDIGHPFGDYLKRAWKIAKARGRGASTALRLAWKLLKADLAERKEPPRDLGDVMREAWARLGVPVEEEEETSRTPEPPLTAKQIIAIKEWARRYMRDQGYKTPDSLIADFEENDWTWYTPEGYHITPATLSWAFGLPRRHPTETEQDTIKRLVERGEYTEAEERLKEWGFRPRRAKEIVSFYRRQREKQLEEERKAKPKPKAKDDAKDRVFAGQGKLGRWKIQDPKKELKELVAAYREAQRGITADWAKGVIQVKGKAFRVPIKAFEMLRKAPPGPIEIRVDPSGFRILWETGGWRFPRDDGLDGADFIPDFEKLLRGETEKVPIKLPPRMRKKILQLPAEGGGTVPWPVWTSDAFPNLAITKSIVDGNTVLIHLKSSYEPDEPIEAEEGMPRVVKWYYSVVRPPGAKKRDLAVVGAFLESHFGDVFEHSYSHGPGIEAKVKERFGEEAKQALGKFIRRVSADYDLAGHPAVKQWQKLEEHYRVAHEDAGVDPSVWQRPRGQKSRGGSKKAAEAVPAAARYTLPSSGMKEGKRERLGWRLSPYACREYARWMGTTKPPWQIPRAEWERRKENLIGVADREIQRIARALFPFEDLPTAMRLYAEDFKYDNPGLVRKFRHVKPDDMVTIYRAVDPDDPNPIRPGDWVALERRYAEGHAESGYGEGRRGKIISRRVPASWVTWAGTSADEWVYSPPYLREPEDSTVTVHEALVREAVELGKPVPPEVLKDYRDRPWAKRALER